MTSPIGMGKFVGAPVRTQAFDGRIHLGRVANEEGDATAGR